MTNHFTIKNIRLLYSAFAIVLLAQASSAPQGNDQALLQISSTKTDSQIKTELVVPSSYVVDLVATASFGVDMNDADDVIGTSYPDPGCGSGCLPPLETVIWKDGSRIVLPAVPGLSGITVTGVNNAGWVCGYAGLQSTITHAVVWKPNGNSYTAIDLGNLPGKNVSTAVGIDDLGRVVGWSTTLNFPPVGAPFMWTELGGMVDLSLLGFPNESPVGISPNGTVATFGYWYQLENTASIAPMAAPPGNFFIQNSSAGINDAGDQVRFLGLFTGGQVLVYPFRYNHEKNGSWQQISFTPTGNLTIYGIGSINDAKDITVTVQSTAMVAFGPDGMTQTLNSLVSPAYNGSFVTSGGPMTADGKILARMIIGQTGQRLVRLVPNVLCVSNCMNVSSIIMKGKGPAVCNQGTNRVKAKITITDGLGNKLSGVSVTGHFLDDYWLDKVVTGVTNSQGIVTFNHVGPPCVGGVAFLVTDASLTNYTFDKSTGTLTNYIIPIPTSSSSELVEFLNLDDDSSIEKIQSNAAFENKVNFVTVQNYPNPFNPSTTISFSIPEKSFVTLKVYDILGKEVAVLVNEELQSGSFEKTFDASSLASGVYIYRLQAGGITELRKMMLTK